MFSKLSIPMAFTSDSIDLSDSSNKYNLGIIGLNGERSANMSAYLADVILGFGTHFSDQITGRERNYFAPNAKKFAFDIDFKECERLKNFATVINIDLRKKLDLILDMIKSLEIKVNSDNLLAKEFKRFWSNLKISQKFVNIIRFYSVIYKYASKDSIFVSDGGGNTFFSCFKI